MVSGAKCGEISLGGFFDPIWYRLSLAAALRLHAVCDGSPKFCRAHAIGAVSLEDPDVGLVS